MNDQYGNPIPADLVAFDNSYIGELADVDLTAIDQLNWYQPEQGNLRPFPGVILMSYAALETAIGIELAELVTYKPADAGIHVGNPEYINSILHRWSDADGIYHA